MRLYKHKNGVYYVALQGNVRKSLCTRNEREAQAKYKQLQRLALNNKLVAIDSSTQVTFKDFTQQFLNTKLDLHKDTIAYYGYAFNQFAAFMGSDTFYINVLTEDTINNYKKWCIDRQLEKTTINVYLTYLKPLLSMAVTLKYLPQPIKIQKLRIPKHLPRVLSIDEIDLILSMCKPEIKRIVQFALFTGCRLSEILNLKWQHIQNNIALVTGKRNKQRTIPLVKGAISAMGTPKNSGYIFTRYERHTVSRYFKTTAVSVGINDVHFHNLRHTAATQMLTCGMSLPVLQNILGHEDIHTTFIYAKVVDQTKFTEMQKLTFPDLEVDF